MKYGKNSVFFIHLYKNICLVSMTTMMVGNNIVFKKKKIWISGCYLMMPWKGYQNFDVFTKFPGHIWSDKPAQYRWNTLIYSNDAHSSPVDRKNTSSGVWISSKKLSYPLYRICVIPMTTHYFIIGGTKMASAHFSDVIWALWRLKPLATGLCVQ